MATSEETKKILPSINHPHVEAADKSQGTEPFFESWQKYSRPRLKKGIETYYPVGPDFRR